MREPLPGRKENRASHQEPRGIWPVIPLLDRREMIRACGLGLLGLGLPCCWAERLCAAEPAAGALTPLNRFPRMVQEYFVRRVREAQDAGDRLRSQVKTKQDAERYVATVRERIRACFGPFPEKTPLNPRVTGVVERDAYRIEKVIFESRPGFLVTANLYVPKGDQSPRPGVVGTCGHSDNGKASGPYQSFAQGLTRLGYVVLIYDPIGQGERLQYPNEKLQSRIGVGVNEHLYCGNQQFLVGEFLGSWRAWDGIRALDYLLTRPEVDSKHVGVTGNSGGGTMTTWLCGVEDRWTMAAPSCFVTTFRCNLENELPADTEQCPPRALALGLDHSDFLAAMAPRPVIIMSQEKDYFDCRGTIETYERLRRLYALLGAEDNIALFIGPNPHGYSRENREAMYRWFNRATHGSDHATEPELVIEEDRTLQCTPRGQVAELGSRPVYSYTRDTSRELAQRRQATEGDALLQAMRSVLKLPERNTVAGDRILRPMPGRRYRKRHCTTYAVQSEPGVHALVHMLSDEPHYSRPPQDRRRAVLYVAHQSSDTELRDEPLIAELIAQEPAVTFYACDVRGIGESRPDTCGKDMFLNPYGSDYFYAIHSIMLDYPYVGQKTHDVLCVLDWLKSNGCGEVHLAARGWGTLPATFAALLSPLVVRVTLKNALTSYAEIAESEDYRWLLSSFVPGILKHFDLPDCYRMLATKGLRQVEPWGPSQFSVERP
ncbi:MAG TPA: prolyl oligopeptidase family serine peptidase [Phycisphaerae bacterium]|nr:prolyl oligopeptidase family serine peptidase [Phycisphaerae bacterium]HRY70022.1 prolyl oligopeptidase family serine peptidase [Phycisphaerae bacterium]HSA27230.1 prolyl oligopeptidase family serine peptidase [Phycisphaerae bacterium]